MDIKGIVKKVCSKYETRNPFNIAKFMDISLVFEPLGSIKGYYQSCYNRKIIHINSDLCEQQQVFACAHELGHSIMHPNLSTPFLRDKTLFVINKFENEADKFAVELLYSDEDFLEYLSFSIPQIAQCLNLRQSLVEYKIKSLKCDNLVIYDA